MITLISVVVSMACIGQAMMDDSIFITAEFAHYEGSLDISPVVSSIRSLEILTDTIERSTLSAKVSPHNKKLFKWLLDHMRYTLEHTKVTISELGFDILSSPMRSPGRSKRFKRAPFSFIGQIQSSLFGTVTEDDFNDFKEAIKKSFYNYESESTLVRGLIAENRNALLKTLDVVQTSNTDLKNSIAHLNDEMILISKLLQSSMSLSAIKRFTSKLTVIRESCDRNYISRDIIPPSVLSSYILQLSDNLKGLSPLYNSKQLSIYYKLQLAVSTISGLDIRQIASIPVISADDMFKVSSAKCLAAHICLENKAGMMILPTEKFLRCQGATTAGLPTVCPYRQCLTSNATICKSFNLTTFLISTKESFEAMISCQNYDERMIISNVSFINVPTRCSVISKHLNIPGLKTMISGDNYHRTVNIPFQITNLGINLNTTGLDLSIKRKLDFKGVRELISSRIPKATFHTDNQQVRLHHGLSIGALSVSSSLVLLLVGLLALLYLCRAKIVTSLQ